VFVNNALASQLRKICTSAINKSKSFEEIAENEKEIAIK